MVAAATAGYQQDTDLLTEFVTECCLLDLAKTVKSAVLWSSYQRWSKDNGEVCLPRRTFIERLAKQFKLSPDRSGHGGIRVWAGIALQLGQ